MYLSFFGTTIGWFVTGLGLSLLWPEFGSLYLTDAGDINWLVLVVTSLIWGFVYTGARALIVSK